MMRLISLCLAALLWCSSVAAKADGSQEKLDFLLPKDLAPVDYDLKIQPNFYGNNANLFTFDGSVTIKFMCRKQTNKVILHAKNLQLSNKKLRSSTGSDIQIQKLEEDKDKEFVIFTLAKDLKGGKSYKLSVDFTGNISSAIQGLYYNKYMRGNNPRYIVGAMFYSIYARTMFPCFDELEFKATFKVTIKRRKDYKSNSNMDIQTSISEGDYVSDVYNPTDKISPCFLAIAVHDFDCIEKPVSNTKVRVCGKTEEIKQGEFALEEAANILPYFEKFFDRSYPLPKLDMFAFPNFNLGSMPHWGFLSFPDTKLFYNSSVSGVERKEGVSTAVTNAIANLWLLNLVTFKWWEDFWMTYGLSSTCERLATDALHPEWKIKTAVRENVIFPALEEDAGKMSYPLFVPVTSQKKINSVMNWISWFKGESVILMLKSIVGEDVFKAAMRAYVKKYAFGNADHHDMLSVFDTASGMDITAIMEPWINQMNYPVVTVNTFYKTNTIEMSQTRFIRNKKEKESTNHTSKYNYMWPIPVSFTWKSRDTSVKKPAPTFWLNVTDKSGTFSFPSDLTKDNWILGNHGGNTFCMVNYDVRNWNALAKQLAKNHKKISPVDRMTLIKTACNLAKSDYISDTICLDMVAYMKKETDYHVMITIFSALGYYGSMLSGRPAYKNYKKWMRKNVATEYDALDIYATNLDFLEQGKTSLIVRKACRYDYEPCLDDMYKLFRDKTIYGNFTNGNLLSTVLCNGIKKSSVSEWKSFYAKLKTMNSLEKDLFITALGCTSNKELLSWYLKQTLTDIDRDNVAEVIRAVGSSNLTFNFLYDNYDKLLKRMEGQVQSENYIIQGMTYNMKTEEQLNKFKVLIKKYPKLNKSGDADKAISKTNQQIEWLKKKEKLISDWLEKKVASA